MTFLRIFFLGIITLSLASCKSPEKTVQTEVPKLKFYTLKNPPSIGKSPSDQEVFLGGFSSLNYIGKTLDGELEFYTITDRGPNAYPIADSKVSTEARPFLIPKYTPEIIKLRTNSKDMSLEILERIQLKYNETTLLSGLPNLEKQKKKTGDEFPVDVKGAPLQFDPMGVDTEGLTRDLEGNFWACEEYRPSILKFDKNGMLLKRFVPIGTRLEDKKLFKVLPEIYNRRQNNRGFEGLTFKNGSLFAVMQSPIDAKKEKNRNVVRILEFSIQSEKVVAEYMLLLDDKLIDKIGDINVIGEDLILILQNGLVGKDSFHKVLRISKLNPISGTPEKADLEKLKSKYQNPAMILDLVKVGYDSFEKIEGLAMVDANTIAVINDNDFTLNGGVDRQNGKVPMDAIRKTVLAIFSL